MKSFSTIISVLSLVSSAWAHGYVKSVEVNGKTYDGREFGSGATDGVVRVITTNAPNYGVDNPALNCGNGAVPVSDLVKANPGDTLALQWEAGGGQFWPHNNGPDENYMAHCTNGDCTTFDSAQARWFKISQEGKRNGQWAQAKYMNGEPAHVTIPDGISPGQYLLRHEIIALHVWDTLGPEYYPSCIQLEIGGNGSGEAAESDLVQIPGAYHNGEPGLGDPYNVQDDYQFPGPKIASFINGGTGGQDGNVGNGGNGHGDGDDTPTSTASGTESTSTTSGAAASSTCRVKKMKKRAPIVNGTYTSNMAKRADALNRPRHVSRIMRALHHISA